MTLVLSWLSNSYVVQVSDRCVTWTDGRSKPDDRNKAVMFGPATFSYSGLAKIGNEWTDEWLARILSGSGTRNVFDAGEFVMRQATKTFAGLALALSLKRHAFVCAGWYYKPPSLRPFLYVVSNAMTDNLAWKQVPQAQFSATLYQLGKQSDTALIHVGQWPQTERMGRLARHVRRADARRAPAAVRDLLAKAIRSVADVQKSVGKDLLGVILPKGGAAPTQSPSASMASGIGTFSVYQMPWAEPKRIYRCGALTVLDQHVLDVAQMLNVPGTEPPTEV